MTANEVALLMVPLGAVLIGAVVLWMNLRADGAGPKARPPAE